MPSDSREFESRLYPKLPGWQKNLSAYLLECRRKQVEMDWASFSCATFAGGAVEAQTSWNPAALKGDIHKSPTCAAEHIRHLGFASLTAVVASLFPAVPVIMGQYGDIAMMPLDPVIARLMPEEIQSALGVVEPPFVWVLATKGVVQMPMTSAQHIFRVG
jgi:hypothetical protein